MESQKCMPGFSVGENNVSRRFDFIFMPCMKNSAKFSSAIKSPTSVHA